jgi:hypothetical protein
LPGVALAVQSERRFYTQGHRGIRSPDEDTRELGL